MEATKIIAIALSGSLILGGSVAFAKDQEGVNAGVTAEMERNPMQKQQERQKKKSVKKHQKNKAAKKTTSATPAEQTQPAKPVIRPYK